MFKTIFLDADDTVFDFDKAQHAAFFAAFEKMGYEVNEKIYALYDKINLSYWKKLERKETTKERLIYDRFTELFGVLDIKGDEVKTEDNYQQFLGDQAFFVGGALDGVRYLAAKYDVYITTNGYAETQLNRVKISGLNKIVKGVFISELAGSPKPNKEYYDYCFEKSGAKKESTLCIGDSLSGDIKGGVDYGLKTMWFNYRNQINSSGIKPDYTVKNWAELLKIL